MHRQATVSFPVRHKLANMETVMRLLASGLELRTRYVLALHTNLQGYQQVKSFYLGH